MTREKNKSVNRFKKSYLLLGILFAGIFLFHKPLLLFGCKVALKTALSSAEGRIVSYEKMQWEKEAIVITDLRIKDLSSELVVDRIECKFLSEFFHLRFAPQVNVVHPQILLSFSEMKTAPLIPFLYRTRFIQPRWTIQGGELQMPGSSLFYFSMDPGAERESIGCFKLSYDPHPLAASMFVADISMRDKKLELGFKLQEGDLSRLLPLTALLFSEVQRDWERALGELDLEGVVSLGEEGELEELHLHGTGKAIALIGPKMGIVLQCDEVEGSFSYPDGPQESFFWDKFSASLMLKNGDCFLSEPLFGHAFGMKTFNGYLDIAPDREPELTLNGVLVHEQKEMEFSLAGKGKVQEDATFWSEASLVLGASQRSQMRSLFSLCSLEEDDLALHVKIENGACEHLDFLRGFSGIPGECTEGTLFAAATLLFKHGICQSVAVENCLLDKIRWYLPDKKVCISSEKAVGSCVFASDLGRQWRLDDLHLQLEGGGYLNPSFHVEMISADVAFDKGVLQTSSLKGLWGNLGAELAFLGPRADHLADLKIDGDLCQLLAVLSSGNKTISDVLPLSLQARVKIDSGVMQLEGGGDVFGQPFQGFACFSTASRTLLDLLAGNFPSFSLKEGNFCFEHWTEKSYGPFVPLIMPGSALCAEVCCQASFLPSRILVKMSGEQLHFDHPLAELHLPQLKAQFFYDLKKEQWQAEIPLEAARLFYRDRALAFENIEGLLKLEESHLKAPSFYAECQGLAMRGEGELDLTCSEGARLFLSTSQIAGDVQGLLGVFGKFSSIFKEGIGVQGHFSSGEKGFVLNAALDSGNEAEWSLQGSFDHLTFPVNKETSIRDAKCDVAFDSKSRSLRVERGEGIWELKDKTPFTVQLKRLSAELSGNCILDFALRVVDGKKEFVQFEGKASSSASSLWDVVFERGATHWGGAQLNIARCVLNRQMDMTCLEMSPVLKCQDLHAQLAFLQNAGFLPQSFALKSLQECQLEGILQAQVSTENLSDGFFFHAESRDLKIKGQPWNSFQVDGQKRGEKWLIEKFKAGGLFLKGALVVDSDGLSFPQFEGSWEEIAMKGSGYLKTEKKRVCCTFESIKGELSALKQNLAEGSFIAKVALTADFSDPNDPLQILGEASVLADLKTPLAATASSRKAVKFTYGKNKGWICTGIDMQLKDKWSGAYLTDFQVEKLIYPEAGGLFLQQMQFCVAPAMVSYACDAKIVPAMINAFGWEGNLEGSGDLQILKTGPVFQGNLKPGRYGFEGKNLPFEQLQLRYEKDLLSVRAKTFVEEQPLWGAMQVNLFKEPYGVLKLFDHPKAEGLKILFSMQNSKVILESVQGHCYGLTCALGKSTKRKIPLATVLTGEVKLDGNVLSALMPQEVRQGMQNLKLGSGYRWEGDLILWEDGKKGFLLNGLLMAQEFEALGYRFRSLAGTIEATFKRVVLSNMKIDDLSGSIAIKKIELNKLQEWDLYIPHLVVHHLQPSLMRKVGEESLSAKPFTIKDFTLMDIRGKLGDKSSLEGWGHLMFINQFKKESSILDAPLEVIKKFGLDPGLLTPVQGELQIELRGDKFYLVSLDNAFSEGDRAEFYLLPQKDPSYIDLDGKVHIDLKMRQDVLLKITEPFTLTIRGSLDKPRYGLQF